MNIKVTKNQRKIILVAMPISIALFYSQWEIPTFLHGKEFDNPAMVDYIERKTGSMVNKPDFIKVISYGEKEADILWVWRGQHMLIEMDKVKTKSGQLKWELSGWHFYTPANGSTKYFFPWYGGIPSISTMF
jgi:hypothetical protein